MAEVIKVDDETGSVLFGNSEEQATTEEVQEVENVEGLETEQVSSETEEQVEVEEQVENVQVEETQEEDQQLIPISQEVEAPAAEEKVPVKVQKYKDDVHAAINKYIEENGTTDLSNFISLYNANFDGLSPEDLIRQQILRDPDNAGISQRLIQKLFEEEVSKYNLDSDDEDEVSIGREKLQRDALKIKRQLESARDEFRSKYKADLEVEVEQETAEQTGPTEEELQLQREAKRREYSEAFKPFVVNGVMKLQDKDGVINVPVKDANAIIEAAIDPVSFLVKSFLNQDGTMNLAGFAEMVAFVTNKNGYKSSLISYGNTRGVGKVAAELKNEVPLGVPRPTGNVNTQLDPNNMPEDFFEKVKVTTRRGFINN